MSGVSNEEGVSAEVLTRLQERDGLGVGFTGAHRTGKTSLCEALHERNPWIPFVRTSTSALAKHVGFDVNNPGSFENRLTFQEMVLVYYREIFEAQNTIFLTDRTPLDFAAYLLAEVPTGDIDPFIDFRVKRYLDDCAAMMNAHFMTIIAVQPGIPYVAEPGKPVPNVAYQEKLNGLMIGLGRSYFKRNFYVLSRGLTKQESRINSVGDLVSKNLGDYYSLLNWQTKQ